MPAASPPLPPKALILAPGDWHRLTCQLESDERDIAARALAIKEKEAIRERSRRLYENWDNTIEKNHFKPLEKKKEADLQAEEEKVRLDEEEKALRCQREKEIIDRAKKLLFYEHPRVRDINSGLRYSEVLRERDLQIQHKRQMERTAAAEAESLDLATYATQLKEEVAERKRVETEKKRLFREGLLGQIEQKRNQKRIEKNLSYSETKANLETAFECKGLNEKQFEIMREKKETCKKDLLEQMKSNENYRQAEQLEQEEEERRANIYYESKEKMKCLIKHKEAERMKRRTDRQKEVGEHLVQLTKPQTEKEDYIIQRVALERDRQFEEREKERHCRKAQANKEFDLFYQHAMANKIRDRVRKKMNAIDNRREFEEDYAYRLKEQERRRLDKIKLKKIISQDYQRQMMEKKVAARSDVAEGKHYYDDLEKEEADIQQYAQGLLKERCGRQNVIPIIHASRVGAGVLGRGPVLEERGRVRPRYMTAVEGVELPHYKAVDYPNDQPPVLT